MNMVKGSGMTSFLWSFQIWQLRSVSIIDFAYGYVFRLFSIGHRCFYYEVGFN